MSGSKQNVVITGGAGMLAADLTSHLKASDRFDPVPLARDDLDVTDENRVKDLLADERPSVLIHTAALHVDDCERDVREAMRINAWATWNLARTCAAIDTTFVFISTCGLFGDQVKAYSEYDPVTLKTAYARSKYEGERLTTCSRGRWLIIRPGWLFGGMPEHRKNFVARRYEEAAKASVIQSAVDKHGSPTWTRDLASRIEDLLVARAHGLFHVVNEGSCSRAEYVRKILEYFELPTGVEGVDSSFFPRPTNTPDCEILTSYNSEYVGLAPLPFWEDALARYIDSIRGRMA